MIGNTFMQMQNQLQAGHDLIRETSMNTARFSVNGKTWQPIYMEPMAVEYRDVVAYKLILSRVNHMFAVRDQLSGMHTENLERYVVMDKEWRSLRGYGVGFVFDYSRYPGWYHGQKKIFGHGDTLERAHWLHQRRVKWAAVHMLTEAA
jgi:hypothetical protein